MIKNKIFHQVAVLLCVVGFYSVAQAQNVVQLKVNEAGDKLTINTPGNCNDQSNRPGCVSATRGRSHITFNLVGNKQCSDVAGATWELDHVAMGNSERSTGSINRTVADDFNADPASGIVSPRNRSGSHIAIQNLNSQTYEAWYTVVATCVGSGRQINSDPRVKNDGTGSN